MERVGALVVRRLDQRLQLRIVKSGEKLTCAGRGCSHCCELMTTSSISDGIRMARSVAARPSVRARFEADFPSHLQLLERTRADREAYWQARQPCILLSAGPERVCKVYEDRPVACRSHFSVDEVSLCADRGPGAGRTLLNVDDEELEANATMLDNELALGLPLGVAPLAILVWWGLRILDLGLSNWEAWISTLPATDPRSLAFWRLAFEEEMKRR